MKASPADKSERREEEAAQRAAFERSLEDTADPLATWLESAQLPLGEWAPSGVWSAQQKILRHIEICCDRWCIR